MVCRAEGMTALLDRHVYQPYKSANGVSLARLACQKPKALTSPAAWVSDRRSGRLLQQYTYRSAG